MKKSISFKRSIKWFFVLALLSGLGVVTYIRATEEEKEADSIEEIEAREGKAIAVSRPDKLEIIDYIRVDAELKAVNRYVLRSNLGEEVEKVLVEEGDTVKPGDLLAVFRDDDIESDIESAQTRLKEAEANYRRFSNLLKRGVVSEDEVEAKRSVLEDSRAAMQKARSRREFTEVRVPVSENLGKDPGDLQVSHREVDPGEFKSPGKMLFTLTDMSVIELRLQVPESAIRYLEKGQKVEFRLEGEEQWRRTVIQRVSPETRDPHRFFTVFAQVDNIKSNGLWLLRPGMYAEARIVKRIDAEATAVPVGSLRISEQGTSSVFIAELDEGNSDSMVDSEKITESTGVVRSLQVETGSRQKGWVEVLSPEIRDDALIIVNPRLDISDGDKVKIQEYTSFKQL